MRTRCKTCGCWPGETCGCVPRPEPPPAQAPSIDEQIESLNRRDWPANAIAAYEALERELVEVKRGLDYQWQKRVDLSKELTQARAELAEQTRLADQFHEWYQISTGDLSEERTRSAALVEALKVIEGRGWAGSSPADYKCGVAREALKKYGATE